MRSTVLLSLFQNNASSPHHSNVGNEAARASNHVLSRQPILAGRIESPIVDLIVIAFGEEFRLLVRFLVHFDHLLAIFSDYEPSQ